MSVILCSDTVRVWHNVRLSAKCGRNSALADEIQNTSTTLAGKKIELCLVLDTVSVYRWVIVFRPLAFIYQKYPRLYLTLYVLVVHFQTHILIERFWISPSVVGEFQADGTKTEHGKQPLLYTSRLYQRCHRPVSYHAKPKLHPFSRTAGWHWESNEQHKELFKHEDTPRQP